MQRRFATFLTALIACVLVSGVARAAAINYGNFVSLPGYTFTNVTESSGTDPVPLFGPPTPFSVGLNFDPTSFVASASGGPTDITDGQLNFGVKGLVVPTGKAAIKVLTFNESGDYSLVGTGSPATQLFAGVGYQVVVNEIDGNAVAPIAIPFTNASAGFNLVANPGILQPWSLSTFVDISAYLTSQNISYTTGATSISVVLNNQLIATSEAASLSFIAKKDFIATVTPFISGNLPEPGSFMLISLAAIPMISRRRKLAA